MGRLTRGRRGRWLLAAATAPLLLLGTLRPAAALSNQGAFTYTGTLTYTPGSGPPISLVACQPNTFTISATGLAADIQIASEAYTGPVSMTGTGASGCGGATVSSGSLTATLTGTGPLGEFSCSVTGSFSIFLETYSSFGFSGNGSCTVADALIGSITVKSLQGNAVPSGVELDPLGPALSGYVITGVGEVCAAWCVI